MDLETLLPALRSLRDLPRLVAALGHQPLWEELPPGRHDRGAPGRSPIIVVGKTAELPWLAIEAAPPDGAAKRLASRMSRMGRPCMVLALAPCERILAVGVGLYDCPTLRVDLTAPGREELASLARLVATSEGGSLAFAGRAADALGAEAVGPRFFREFRATLESLASGLPGSMRSEDRHGLALLQLTRVLFLYFVQTKGWLAGRDRFMAQEVDRCLRQRRRIHRDLLRPLFFGTLNQPLSTRGRTAVAFGPIPFLNGGLFEPHPLERRFKSDISDELWRHAFDGLFERFHFTVAENATGGSVAPDMLGRVFEGVMSPELRHASGTFYTPAAVVARLLNAGMSAFLAIRLRCGDAEAERRCLDPDREAAEALSAITLLDPAVGSGAFLVGALERLYRMHPGALISDRKRAVLQRNLFGVDLSAAAVRLTELRLWLAVIADDPAEKPAQIRPLPNLDCLIRQGDSLFDPIDHGLGGRVLRSSIVRELSGIRRSLITAIGADKKSLVRRLRVVEGRALDGSLEVSLEQNRAELAECLQEARRLDLFGQRRGLDVELRSRLTDLRRTGRLIQGARRLLAREGELPWFHYQSHFADVFAREGFDLVVGNPPWLRSENVAATVRARLSQRYRWWRTSGAGYGNKPDMAVAFLERSFELAAPGGVVAMLVPSKIATARYASMARHSLASTTTLHAVVDLTNDSGAAFDATVYPMAIVASKTSPSSVHEVRTSLTAAGVPAVRQAELAGGGPWILVRSELREILTAWQTRHPKLGEMFACHLGLKTGANDVFLDPPEHLEPEVLRWALRGRDVVAFRCQPRVRLLWTHDRAGQPQVRLPAAAAQYLLEHATELRARKDFTRGPIWTVFRVRTAIARYRVVWADVARKLAAAALTTVEDHRQVPLNSCYVVALRSAVAAECLAACLNSTWLRVAAQLSAVPAAGGYSRFNARTIAELPLPASATHDPILSRLAREGRTGADVQEHLDIQMAKHLGISGAAQNALRSVVDGADHRR
jgi:Eco57I restriction-modification methylase